VLYHLNFILNGTHPKLIIEGQHHLVLFFVIHIKNTQNTVNDRRRVVGMHKDFMVDLLVEGFEYLIVLDLFEQPDAPIQLLGVDVRVLNDLAG
jgi:hypothetical protein